jgi:hypothetical protein
VVEEVGGVFGAVSFAAAASGFFVHPCDHAQGAGGTQVEALENFGSFHGDGDAGGIVDGAGAEIPGIEMSGDDYDLLGMLGAFEVCDDVIAALVRELLRSKREVHAHFALSSEVSDQVGVFGGDSSGGNSGGKTESGVREAIVGAGDGANQGSDCAEIGGGFGSGSAVTDGLAVGGKGVSASGLLLVEEFVKEDDLAGDFVVAESLEFVECVDRDYVGGEAVWRSGRASTQSSKNDLLCGAGNHSGILDECSGFGSANPVRNGDLLEADIQAEMAKLSGDVLRRGEGLR